MVIPIMQVIYTVDFRIYRRGGWFFEVYLCFPHAESPERTPAGKGSGENFQYFTYPRIFFKDIYHV